MTIFAFMGYKILCLLGMAAIITLFPFLVAALCVCLAGAFGLKKKGMINAAIVVFIFTGLATFQMSTDETGPYPSAKAGLLKTYSEFKAEKEKPTPRPIELGTELRQFILVGYNPPKHFYVTLKDTQSGQVYERQYVSKHCNNHAGNPIGATYNINVRKYAMSDLPADVKWQFLDLYGVFCK